MNLQEKILALEKSRAFLVKTTGCSKVIARELAQMDAAIRELKEKIK